MFVVSPLAVILIVIGLSLLHFHIIHRYIRKHIGDDAYVGGSAFSVAQPSQRVSYRFTPASGDTITIPDITNDMDIYIIPSADIAALTLNWPTNPRMNQRIQIITSKSIGVLSHTGGTLARDIKMLGARCCFEANHDTVAGVWMVNDSPSPLKVYRAGVLQTNVIAYIHSVTTVTGIATFQMTDDGTSGGVALFDTIFNPDGIIVTINNKDYAHPSAINAISGNKKTLTVDVSRLVINLGLLSISAAPTGVTVAVVVYGKNR